jgi:hypothetical protein
MSQGESQLTKDERTHIAAHAQRLASYAALRGMVGRWRAEASARDRADRFVKRAFGALLALLIILGAVWWAWLAMKRPEIDELPPAFSLRAKAPAIQAYEDAWWSAVRRELWPLCAAPGRPAEGRYSFVVWVDEGGGILRVAINGTEPEVRERARQMLAGMRLAPFTAEQKAYRSALGLRGYLFLARGRCEVQRW